MGEAWIKDILEAYEEYAEYKANEEEQAFCLLFFISENKN